LDTRNSKFAIGLVITKNSTLQMRLFTNLLDINASL